MNKKFTIVGLIIIFIYLIFINSIIWIPGFVEGNTYVKLLMTFISIVLISPAVSIVICALKIAGNKST